MKNRELLELFENLDIEDSAIFELKLLKSEVENIGYKALVDLAQIFFMKMLSPNINNTTITLKFQKLNTEKSFHNTKTGSEKYGIDSEFFTINKTAQFSFLYYYQEALKFINIKTKTRILNLGVNRGDEFSVIKNMLDFDEFSMKNFVGIDYCTSAIEYAKKELPYSNMEFISHNINDLDRLDLGKFDLIISIGTLQSSNIKFNAMFMSLYQNYLEEGGAIVLGFPNCRWIDGEMIYGAKTPNYPFSEMSLVLKDIHFCKKYLQQKKYRVVVRGKEYIFLSARKFLQ